MRAAMADLVGDIRAAGDFYSAGEGSKIDRAYVVGGAASTIGLVPTLASVLRVPVTAASGQLATPGRSLTPAARELAGTPATASVVGLALGAL